MTGSKWNLFLKLRIFSIIELMDGENMRVFVVGKRERKWAATIGAALFILAILIPIGVSAGNKLLPIYRVQTEENKIALTFDVA